MEDEQYAAISGYLERAGLKIPSYISTKSQKFILRRSCKNYKLLIGKLYYKEQIQDRTERDRRVVKRSEANSVFLKCTNEKKDRLHTLATA